MSHQATYGMYLAVLPSYRRECIDVLMTADPTIELYCADAHLNPSVRTGIDPQLYTRTKMARIGSKAFIQLGSWGRALRLTNLIVDLNPRSGAAWALLLTRRIVGRRTMVWGHLYPQSDKKAGIARRVMRNLAHGTICYTYSQGRDAKRDMPDQPVWVAPNALYRAGQLAPRKIGNTRTTVLYVGRLEREKRVDLFVDAFAASGLDKSGVKAVIVGFGATRAELELQAQRVGIGHAVTFAGRIESAEALGELYDDAFCSVSPGFGGLGITQSLGFGVPMVITRGIEHSPEIELTARWPSATYWAEDDADSFGAAIRSAYEQRASVPAQKVQEYVRSHYSAEAMAAGLLAALRGTTQEGKLL